MEYRREHQTKKNNKGSLSLEQVLFVAAVVAISAGLTTFYGNISDYLGGMNFDSLPQDLG